MTVIVKYEPMSPETGLAVRLLNLEAENRMLRTRAEAAERALDLTDATLKLTEATLEHVTLERNAFAILLSNAKERVAELSYWLPVERRMCLFIGGVAGFTAGSAWVLVAPAIIHWMQGVMP